MPWKVMGGDYAAMSNLFYRMKKILFTIDELTGLIAATAMLRPSKSILDLELKSVNFSFTPINDSCDTTHPKSPLSVFI